jgi:ribosome maturation factor RimP
VGDAVTGTSAGAARRGTGTDRVRLVERLAPVLASAGYDLEDVTVARAGRRSLLRVVVDRDGGIDLDAVAEASRLVSGVLDADLEAGQDALPGPYVLEVTSPGTDRPLTLPRHWRRAAGRLVSVSLADGRDVVGRVVSADEDAAELRIAASGALRVLYPEVTLAVVQVEFGGEGTSAGATTGGAGTGGSAKGGSVRGGRDAP